MASRTLEERQRQPYSKGAGLNMFGMLGQSAGKALRSENVTGNPTQMVDLIGVDSFGLVEVNSSFYKGLKMPMVFNLATNASLSTQRFFVADQPYEIRAISVSYATADGATNTAFVTKEVSGQAPGAGVSVQTGTFNLNTTTNTAQWAVLPNRDNPGYFGKGEPLISLNTGEMLSLKIANAVASLAGLIVTVYAIPQNALNPATYIMNANASIATQAFYLANRYVTVTGVTMVWSAAGTDAGAVTLDVTHETTTGAPGTGNSILSAAQSVKGTANVPVTPALTATASRLALIPGDRLSVKLTGTLTALAGVVVIVSFAGASVDGVSYPMDVIIPQFALNANASNGTNQAMFGPADRDYEVYDVSWVWSAAGGGGTVNLSIDPSGTAPGAGTTVGTNVTNSSTANTVVIETKSVSKQSLLLPAGGLLSVVYAGTKGSLAGVVAAASLIPM